MGVIDWIILAVLLVMAFLGYRKGFAKTAVSIGGAIATFYLIGQVYPLLRNLLIATYKFNATLATTIAILLFLLIMGVVVIILAWLLNRVLSAIHLTGLNKLFGLLFGLLHGLVVVMVCMIVLDYLPSLSGPLKDPEAHKAYYRVDRIKEGVFKNLNLNQKSKYLEIIHRDGQAQQDK